MATGEPQPARTRSIQEWADVVAVGGLVLAGLLVSVCAPILRRRNETLRDELDHMTEVVDYQAGQLAELSPGEAIGVEDQAAAPEPPEGGIPLPHLARELNGQGAELGADAP